MHERLRDTHTTSTHPKRTKNGERPVHTRTAHHSINQINPNPTRLPVTPEVQPYESARRAKHDQRVKQLPLQLHPSLTAHRHESHERASHDQTTHVRLPGDVHPRDKPQRKVGHDNH